jgi:hypothetical protein
LRTGRRPRVLFDAFNLEATSDDIQEEARVEYNADKKPAKVIAQCFHGVNSADTRDVTPILFHVFYQGILRKSASSRGPHASAGEASQGSDSDALWTAGTR